MEITIEYQFIFYLLLFSFIFSMFIYFNGKQKYKKMVLKTIEKIKTNKIYMETIIDVEKKYREELIRYYSKYIYLSFLFILFSVMTYIEVSSLIGNYTFITISLITITCLLPILSSLILVYVLSNKFKECFNIITLEVQKKYTLEYNNFNINLDSQLNEIWTSFEILKNDYVEKRKNDEFYGVNLKILAEIEQNIKTAKVYNLTDKDINGIISLDIEILNNISKLDKKMEGFQC